MTARDDHYIRNVERGTAVVRLQDLNCLELTSVVCVNSLKSALFLLSAPATAIILLTPLFGLIGTMLLFLFNEDPLVRVCAIACVLLSILAATNLIYRIFPKASSIDVVREGLLLQTDEPHAPASLIPWETLGALDVKTERTTFLRNEEWLYLPLRLRIGTGNAMVIPYRIKWSDVLKSVDVGQFLSALRTFAPHADLSPELRKLVSAPETSRTNYTELWLHEFSRAPRRLRLEPLECGTKLGSGRYEVVGRLGMGGQGVAYLAIDQSDRQDVVLKEYILPVYREAEFLEAARQKLEREANILKHLSHPQIIRLLDFFMEDYRGYLVLEYVEGETLRALVQREGAQPESTARAFTQQVCNIAFHLHSLQPPVVHRDITPENLILQPDGTIKLVDFNVAQQKAAQTTATIVGKHAYLAPEQFRGKPTTQSDIYSIGCTLYFLLTGEDPEAITRSSPRSTNDSVSEWANKIVEKSTATSCELRYQDIKDMLIDLARDEHRK
jgi:tRNA A-37 threonylcarbamoyl transferase component Bud32